MGVVIIGKALDGPTGSIFKGDSFKDYLDLFGGTFVEQTLVAPDATGVDLSFIPFDTPTNVIAERGRNQLYDVDPSGAYVSFGALGGPDNLNLTLTYRPYCGTDDLLTAVQHYQSLNSSLPMVVRAECSSASLTEQGWTFLARYPGSKYNQVSLEVASSILTISGLGEFGVCTYDVSDPDDLMLRVNNDCARGLCPVQVLTKSGVLTNFISTLTGGSDVPDYSSTIKTTNYPFEATQVSILSEITSDIIDAVENVSLLGVPRLFFCGYDPVEADPSGDIAALDISVPYRHNLLVCTFGRVDQTIGNKLLSRYASEAVSFIEGPLTNSSLKVDGFSPLYSAEELNELYDAGFVGLTERILGQAVPYKGVTTGNEKDYARTRTIIKCGLIINQIMYPYLGLSLPEGRMPDAEDQIYYQLSYETDLYNIDVDVTCYYDAYEPSTGVTVGSIAIVNVKGTLGKELFQLDVVVKVSD